MLFASEELAVRIERAEAGLVADAARRALAPAARRREGDAAFVEPLSGGWAVFTATGSPLSKVAGVGFAGPLDEAELSAIEAAYAERDCPVRFEVSTLADPSVATLLTRRGYTLVGFENVLGRQLSEDESGLELGPGTFGEIALQGSAGPGPPPWLDTWLEVVVSGFATPDTRGVPSDEEFPRAILTRILGDFARTEEMATYLALRGGEPVGGASMRTTQGVALLCGAATLPAHRRRGVQAALLARRLADAAAEGCDVAAVTTQPGSTSQQNVQRKGFELLYSRAVLVR